MVYHDILECCNDLEAHGQLIRIREEVDPYLEMAAIQRRIYQKQGPAILFEKVKGSKYPCVSNLFGTLERCHFIFRNTFPLVEQMIQLQSNLGNALKAPFKSLKSGIKAITALPKKASGNFEEIAIQDLPMIQCWEKDGGAFITLPQVYSENLDKPGVMHANIGMYRIQLSGNQYELDKEIGIHYQIHRGIGINQKIAQKHNQPLKVSIFVGGPPAHTVAAVMPLPEGMSELTFAGLLAGRRFRYFTRDGFTLSADADFVITGYLSSELKPEGPFGDHLGYYSLTHDFPMLKVHKVYAKKDAIWPFTVVGRPPQEDTSFGALIHEMTGDAISKQIPGVVEVHAVDAAGVHPLLLAIGTERYTPYLKESRPAEILIQANRILGTGQLSLAKYLFITAQSLETPSTHDVANFFRYILERIDFERDIHFQTCTTVDTLDYSGNSLNEGSKVIFAANGSPKRQLAKELPENFSTFPDVHIISDGIVALKVGPFNSYENMDAEISAIENNLKNIDLSQVALLILCDDSSFLAKNLDNFLWLTFTRSDPARDIHGIGSFIKDKHWGCKGPLIIDARKKPHHAPELIENEEVLKKISSFFALNGTLHGY